CPYLRYFTLKTGNPTTGFPVFYIGRFLKVCCFLGCFILKWEYTHFVDKQVSNWFVFLRSQRSSAPSNHHNSESELDSTIAKLNMIEMEINVGYNGDEKK